MAFLPQLPKSEDEDFWGDSELNRIEVSADNCKHEWSANFRRRECICRSCGLGFDIKPEMVNEKRRIIEHEVFGRIKF